MSNEKLLKLFKRGIPSTRHEFVDYDYVQSLFTQSKSKNQEKAKEAREALAYLQLFNGEYYGNRIDEDSLHNTPELVKSVYDATNSANRDVATAYSFSLIRDNTASLELDQQILTGIVRHGKSTQEDVKSMKVKPNARPLKIYTQEEREAFAASRGFKSKK